MVVNVCGLAGYQTTAGCGCCQPSQATTEPLYSKELLSATIGPPRSPRVAIGQAVGALLGTAAAGVSPALTALSAASSSMPRAGAPVARAVTPPAAVSPSEKPESA